MQIGPYWLAVGETGFGGLGWRPSFEAGPTDKKTKLGRRWRVLSELWLIRQRSPTVGSTRASSSPVAMCRRVRDVASGQMAAPTRGSGALGKCTEKVRSELAPDKFALSRVRHWLPGNPTVADERPEAWDSL
jgi:hypothetical protein